MGRGRGLGGTRLRPRNRHDAHGCLNACFIRNMLSPPWPCYATETSMPCSMVFQHASTAFTDLGNWACSAHFYDQRLPPGYCSIQRYRDRNLHHPQLHIVQSIAKFGIRCGQEVRMSPRRTALATRVRSEERKRSKGRWVSPYWYLSFIRQAADNETLHAALIVRINLRAELHRRIDKVLDPHAMIPRDDVHAEWPVLKTRYRRHRWQEHPLVETSCRLSASSPPYSVTAILRCGLGLQHISSTLAALSLGCDRIATPDSYRGVVGLLYCSDRGPSGGRDAR